VHTALSNGAEGAWETTARRDEGFDDVRTKRLFLSLFAASWVWRALPVGRGRMRRCEGCERVGG
jgi:hypothetical protein